MVDFHSQLMSQSISKASCVSVCVWSVSQSAMQTTTYCLSPLFLWRRHDAQKQTNTDSHLFSAFSRKTALLTVILSHIAFNLLYVDFFDIWHQPLWREHPHPYTHIAKPRRPSMQSWVDFNSDSYSVRRLLTSLLHPNQSMWTTEVWCWSHSKVVVKCDQLVLFSIGENTLNYKSTRLVKYQESNPRGGKQSDTSVLWLQLVITG